MLIITRRPGERIVLGDDIVVTVMEISGQTARIGIAAPRELPVYREEIWEAVKAENQAAASVDPDALPPCRRRSATRPHVTSAGVGWVPAPRIKDTPARRSRTHRVSTLLGTTLNGRYRLEARIGTGGMSSVYRALDETLERPVAIKLMNREIATDSDQLERFRREARAVAQLSHPHIVGVIDYGEDQGRPYIVLEYVEGETLKERIRRNGELDVSEAVAYAIEIARALGAAHARHIVHRDVKPQNVLIDEEGSAKVTDFGIARSLDDDGLTADGRVLGTTDYVSPEQALGHDVTGQSDLYSLGIVLYEMLTGSVPFRGENQVAVAMKHVREELPDVQALRPEVSASLAAVIDRATAKDLHERYRSDEELIADLEDVLALEAARSGSATGEATTVLRTLPSTHAAARPAARALAAGLARARGAAGRRRARGGDRAARRPHAPRHRHREDGGRRRRD